MYDFDFDDLPEEFPDRPILKDRTDTGFSHAKAKPDTSSIVIPPGLPRLAATARHNNSDTCATETESSLSDGEDQCCHHFPSSFVLGVATSAFQIEGGSEEDGRKPSIWDDFTRMKDKVTGGVTADIACDHYHCFRTDVAIMAHLGIQAYRFSISWSRLIPDGVGRVNEKGVRFYSDLIDALIECGIEPWVTLYHWDLPSALVSRFGGWLGPKDQMVAAFAEFARTCFRHFGDRVKHWMTINEPWCVAILGHATGIHAPGGSPELSTDPYIVGHNLILAHAEAVHIYRSEFAALQCGHIGIVLNVNYRWAFDSSSDLDKRAAQRSMDFEVGWFADPIFHGDYPCRMRETCGRRLPEFTAAEKHLIKGSSDFLGVNFYFATYAVAPAAPLGCLRERRRVSGSRSNVGANWYGDVGVRMRKDPTWEQTDTGWYITPLALRDALVYLHTAYHPPCGIVITENGCAHESEQSREDDELPGALNPTRCGEQSGLGTALSSANFDPDETIADPRRVDFIRSHLKMVHSALMAGVDVRGYFVWSLMDNFEWSDGYNKRFGIVRVDYTSQKRVIKSSGRFFSEFIAKRRLDL